MKLIEVLPFVPLPTRIPLAARCLAVSLSLALLVPQQSSAQGCVAARGSGATSCLMGGHDMMADGATDAKWQASVGYRWLHSDRHFTGSHEETQRQAEGSEVINDSHFIDVGISYRINPRFSVSAALPIVVNDRSQVVRNTARAILGRFHTQSSGIGDARLMANAWIWNPETHRKGNLNLGMGVLLPTGEKDATDIFQVFRAGQVVSEERTVDQSIQPGSGGWGIILDLYGYQEIMPRLNAYVNGSYTITPEEQNGVRTFRNGAGEGIMSIADGYMGRTGFDFLVAPKYGVTLSLGGRIEGVPVHDAIGGSTGFRRPGFAVSIEPGVSVAVKSWSFNLSTPVAVYRNRQRSVPDQARGAHGDAAFADYTVQFSVAKRF
ncbi:MAG: hypothetical protein JNN07_08625 [Verrucomicrobiales bacterium]|nr:hypothetical protein [Verrucomicrobiales bacterium]